MYIFFPVGHTHCDIDQLFSRLAHWLKDKPCLDKEWLLWAAKECCYKVVEAMHLKCFTNWKDSVAPYISSSFQGVTNFR